MSDTGQNGERRFPEGGEGYLEKISEWNRDEILRFVEALLSASLKKRPENGGADAERGQPVETTRNT